MRHSNLRKSLSLEIFLCQSTQNGFQQKVKELNKFLKKQILITNQTTKKQFDYLIPKKPLESFPNDQNYIEAKLSSNIKKYFMI